MGAILILEYLFIFFAKILEVSLMTVRTVLITRGEKLWGSIIGFVEVVIWVYLVGNIITNVTDDPIKVIVYSLGFATGNYVGLMIEEKLALGLINFSIIASKENGHAIAKLLRDNRIGVTTVGGNGLKEEKEILMVYIKRKRKAEVMKILNESNINCVVSISDTNVVYGGYGLKK